MSNFAIDFILAWIVQILHKVLRQFLLFVLRWVMILQQPILKTPLLLYLRGVLSSELVIVTNNFQLRIRFDQFRCLDWLSLVAPNCLFLGENLGVDRALPFQDEKKLSFWMKFLKKVAPKREFFLILEGLKLV